MDSGTISFLIWCMFGSMFFGFAAYAWVSVKPVGFWANANVFEVTDISKYNHAVAKLFCIFGIVTILLGIPLLTGTNSPWVLFTIFGLMAESILAMAVYTLIIEKKYKK